MKALRDFSEWGITVKAGDEIKPGVFEADQVASLVAKGAVEAPAKPPEAIKEIKVHKPKPEVYPIAAPGAYQYKEKLQ